MIVTVSKWKAGQITDITLFTNEEVDPCADEDEVKEGLPLFALICCCCLLFVFIVLFVVVFW